MIRSSRIGAGTTDIGVGSTSGNQQPCRCQGHRYLSLATNCYKQCAKQRLGKAKGSQHLQVASLQGVVPNVKGDASRHEPKRKNSNPTTYCGCHPTFKGHM